MRYFLYYAGMAEDRENEQIGAAVSDDGLVFERVGDAGLVLRRDPRTRWQALRVCNPTVLYHGGRFLMWYQGIEPQTLHTSIGLAVSSDGIEWHADPEPCIPWESMRRVDPKFDPTTRVGLFEPAVIHDGVFKMWFIYSTAAYPMNSLWHATSADGRSWDIQPQPSRVEGIAGPYRIHYPQVVRSDDGYELYFMLRNVSNGFDGVFQTRSTDGMIWDPPRQLLPPVDQPIVLAPRQPRSIAGREAQRIRRGVARRVDGAFNLGLMSRNGFGWGHPHVIGSPSGRRLYYQNSNSTPDGDRRFDIGCSDFGTGDCTRLRTVFGVGPRGAWDAHFVADPFVLAVDS